METLLKIIWWGIPAAAIIMLLRYLFGKVLEEQQEENDKKFYTIDEVQEMRTRQMKRINEFKKH